MYHCIDSHVLTLYSGSLCHSLYITTYLLFLFVQFIYICGFRYDTVTSIKHETTDVQVEACIQMSFQVWSNSVLMINKPGSVTLIQYIIHDY